MLTWDDFWVKAAMYRQRDLLARFLARIAALSCTSVGSFIVALPKAGFPTLFSA